jgi:hypothetical protein
MEQTGFCRDARLDNMLEISFLVLGNILDRVTVTGASDECGSVNDKGT